MSEGALKLSSVNAGYGDTVVIDGVDLVLDKGEAISIVGRNGVGKSSLLATLMGHTTMHGGTIELLGRNITRTKPYDRVHAGLGYVPQEREVFPSLSVIENLEVAKRAEGEWNIERVCEMFPRLADRRANRASQLSGGEQQMLAIGRALMTNPRVLLMDEPSEGLAPIVVEALTETIIKLRDETAMTIALVEQHVDMALEFAPRVVVMERGQIAFDGASEELKADTQRMHALIGIGRD